MPRRAAGDVRAYERVETEPGLDKFAGDAQGSPPESCARTCFQSQAAKKEQSLVCVLFLWTHDCRLDALCKSPVCMPCLHTACVLAAATTRHSPLYSIRQHSCIWCYPAGLQTRALGPLLDWAAAVMPARQHSRTPVFLLGTAGLRRLPDEQEQELLVTACDVLAASPFRCPRLEVPAMPLLLAA